MSVNKIVVPAYLQSLGTRADGGERLTFVTDRLSNEQVICLRSLHKDSYGFLLFKGAVISKDEEDLLDSIDQDMTNKPPSQRMRAVLYRMWEQKNEGFEKFKDYYSDRMEKLIEKLKSKLD